MNFEALKPAVPAATKPEPQKETVEKTNISGYLLKNV